MCCITVQKKRQWWRIFSASCRSRCFSIRPARVDNGSSQPPPRHRPPKFSHVEIRLEEHINVLSLVTLPQAPHRDLTGDRLPHHLPMYEWRAATVEIAHRCLRPDVFSCSVATAKMKIHQCNTPGPLCVTTYRGRCRLFPSYRTVSDEQSSGLVYHGVSVECRSWVHMKWITLYLLKTD